jgi:hypothetical protein
MRMGNLLGDNAVDAHMSDTHLGVRHVTVVPANYDDEESSTGGRTGR